jgi:hypothetical protein
MIVEPGYDWSGPGGTDRVPYLAIASLASPTAPTAMSDQLASPVLAMTFLTNTAAPTGLSHTTTEYIATKCRRPVDDCFPSAQRRRSRRRLQTLAVGGKLARFARCATAGLLRHDFHGGRVGKTWQSGNAKISNGGPRVFRVLPIRRSAGRSIPIATTTTTTVRPLDFTYVRPGLYGYSVCGPRGECSPHFVYSPTGVRAPSVGVGKPHNVIKYVITAVGVGFCLRSECISMNLFVPSAIWPRRMPDFTIHSL